MILVFGGTTEGKITADLLDFLGESYFYSTKRSVILDIKGMAIYGKKNAGQLAEFCQNNNVGFIINAAHPFAQELHHTIYQVANQLDIPTVRFERSYPNLSKNAHVQLFSSYEQMMNALLNSDFQCLLSLTGVQTIPHYAKVIKQKKCYFRVLNTSDSKKLANKMGVDSAFVIPGQPSDNIEELCSLVKELQADVLLTKESGESGFFLSKLAVAEQLNIPLWVVQRPVLPAFHYTVYSQKELLQTVYILRRRVCKDRKRLLQGYTTGTCVMAAAKACAIGLQQHLFPKTVSVELPDGESVRFLIFPEMLTKNSASCVVVKNAGDDPDITHGKEIGCELSYSETPGIHFARGKGVGTVTLPGLQLSVGEPAINPKPREMITTMLEVYLKENNTQGFVVKPFVPEGEELASKTFNPRVGVVGGISIIGSSGRVIPFSSEAFLATLEYQMAVAIKAGVEDIVLTSGKRSEHLLSALYPHLPETSFIHFGNYIGHAIRLAMEMGAKRITLGLMLGKAIKLAEGHFNTHSKFCAFNPAFAAQIASEGGYNQHVVLQIGKLKLANAIRALIPFSPEEWFYSEIARRCFINCLMEVKEHAAFRFDLITEHGKKISFNNFAL